MGKVLPEVVERLIKTLMFLPGVGEKTAMRYAIYIIGRGRDFAKELSEALRGIESTIGLCPECFNISEGGLCGICSDGSRDRATICVVENFSDLIAIEKSGEFKGVYHVLKGAISPMKGVNPADLTVENLIRRIERLTAEPGNGRLAEVIIATDPDMEGETTALYLKKLLYGQPVRVTRIALGVPMGGSLEYSDVVTLTRAMKGRSDF